MRKIVADSGAALDESAPFATPYATLGDALLAPTRIYVKSLLPILARGEINALAHITGGGLTENLPRVLPAGVSAQINLAAWKLPPVFAWMQKVGDVTTAEMLRTFNCGIGMIAVVPKAKAAAVVAALESAGETIIELGQLVAAGAERVTYSNALVA